jgi:hypothetical protein
VARDEDEYPLKCDGCGDGVPSEGFHWFPPEGFTCTTPKPMARNELMPEAQSLYEQLRKLYKRAPEGSYAKLCLQLACRCVQVACRKETWRY